MTAEVGVLNRNGVALAADSALSIGHQADKIYGSAEKLFQLSNSAPVGVMVYGNASIGFVPWDTVIKSYRQSLGDKRFPFLRDYAVDFLAYLPQRQELFLDQDLANVAEVLIGTCLFHLRESILGALRDAMRGRSPTAPPLKDAAVRAIASKIAQTQLQETIKRARLDTVDAKFRRQVLTDHRSLVSKLRKEILQNLPFDGPADKAINRLVVETLTRKRFGPLESGIVFAGFGEREFLPALVDVDIEDMISRRPRFHMDRHIRIGHDSNAHLVPFAQGEMVHVFMEGIDEALDQFLVGSTAKLFVGLAEGIAKTVGRADKQMGDQLQAALRPKVKVLLQKLVRQWKSKRSAYAAPVMEIVASLPKDELAAMAEALVNLTKFRRRVTTERETVGGPIDVVVISKGDGFVWVKRKHYFEPALNPRIMARYGREGA